MDHVFKVLLLLCWVLVGHGAARAAEPNAPALAFFYGDNPPWNELQAFDVVVVDPDHVPDPLAPGLAHTRLAAYVSLGEVVPSRRYATAIPPTWLVGENKNWRSRLIDQSQPDWPKFFADQVVAPLWEKGYRTFFLDTLDSYQLFAKTPEQRAAQEAGMVTVIQTLKQRYPDIKLMFNRGFELLPKLHPYVERVVVESLFQGYDAGQKTYREVSVPDRDWLLTQLRHVRDDYQLEVVVIDYVPAANRALARDTAQRILQAGFTPWVATPDLASLGVGSIEVLPRKVLVVHSTLENDYALRNAPVVRLGALPLNYLGRVPEYVDLQHLPEAMLVGRYAGVVVWLSEVPSGDERGRLLRWLTAQVAVHLPVALVNPPDFLLTGAMAEVLGLKSGQSAPSSSPAVIAQQSDLFGFEVGARPGPEDLVPLTLVQGDPLMTLRQEDRFRVVAATMPWGGFVLEGFSVTTLPGRSGNRWVINPFSFFEKALHLPKMPVPDVTTETGRRMLMVHMDGDGFVSRSELPGNPVAGQLIRDRVVQKYRVPMTMSVIEAEISPTGLYPALSPAAEEIAREIFRQPHVAIASHSYSHPFDWGKAVESDLAEGYNLSIPGYHFDLQREIGGSIHYIESRLAPPDKKVEMFLWTGNCIPGSDALSMVGQAGIMNMNGGDTVATRSQPTVTQVEGLGLQRAGGYQVFAPGQNENTYTNNWLGPFYGYERVIETFDLTERPRRLKPINIYFHAYITTKAAGMQSLDKVFAYALAQETTPVHISDYARKVLDFQSMAIARTRQGWRIRGATHLRTLRLPPSEGWPDVSSSQGVAGFNKAQDGHYVHLSHDAAQLVLRQTLPAAPRLLSANAHIERFQQTDDALRWDLSGYAPLKFSIANAQRCQMRVAGSVLKPTRLTGDVSEFEMNSHVARPLEAICQR